MPLVLDMQRISLSVWAQFQDSSGKILDEYSARKWTFHEGISPDVRGEVWLFLLGYYPFLSTREEREAINEEKRLEYHRLLDSWQGGVMPDGLGEYVRVIGKDCVRTDRSHASFCGNGQEALENIETLNRILTTYCVYNPELGYVQGMNEFLAPLYLVLGSEHQAFWCLTAVIRRMTGVFSDLTLSQPLQTVARLCYYADTQLHDHIKGIHGEDEWMFCYRGVLLNFKREFSMEDLYSLWEIIWCNHLTKHFQLFVAVAILVHYKQEIINCGTVEALMQFAMSLSCNAPLAPILTIARALTEQLKGEQYCPHELRYLVSDEGCAPPPLVGFVRARQRFSTLHSNKISMSSVWKALFGDTNHPITSPFVLSPTQTTPTRRLTFVSPQATPTHHHPLTDNSVVVEHTPHTPSSHTITPSTPIYGGSNLTSLTNTSSSNALTATNAHSPVQFIAGANRTEGAGMRSPKVGPPPKMGFVPRNSSYVQSSPVHSALKSNDFIRQSPVPSYQSPSHSARFNSPHPSLNGCSAVCPTNDHALTLSTLHYMPTSNDAHTTPSPHTLTLSTPHYMPMAPNRSQQNTTATRQNHSSTTSDTLTNVPLNNQSPCHQNHPGTVKSGAYDFTRHRSSTVGSSTECMEPPSCRSRSNTSACGESSFGGSLKTRALSEGGTDAVHYDHRNGTLSGGVFDKVEPVSSHESLTGMEFDHLRSEPSLIA